MHEAHTSGRWSYNRDEGGVHGHVISTGDLVICELPDAGDGGAPHTEANARLITAAPDLLEALEQAIVVMRRTYDECSDSIKMAVVAIAEAKGGAQKNTTVTLSNEH